MTHRPSAPASPSPPPAPSQPTAYPAPPSAGTSEPADPATPTTASSAHRLPSPAGPQEWSVSVCRDGQALTDLATEWDDLLDRCSTATPFQCHAWLDSWWRTYGRPGRLRLVLVRHRGRLVAAAALMLMLRPLPVLVPVGAGLSDFGDILLDDTCADEAAAALVRALPIHRPWSLLDMREVRPTAATQRLVTHWPGARQRLPDSLCQHLPGVPMEEVLQRMSTQTAKRTRRKLRRNASEGVVVRHTPPEEMPRAIADMLRLHELQWRGRGATPEHLRERFAGHLTRAATTMAAADRVAVHEFLLDGELIACHLTVLSPSLIGLYLYGVHPKARERLDISGMLLGECAALATQTGRTEVNLLRGTEPYKQRWRPSKTRNDRLLLGGTAAIAVYGSAVRLRAAALRHARAHLPWLAEVRSQLRNLRAPRRT
ncbi:GNAT family N-acetyltransferase [Kitasatospora atroaurantiaca]|uniref:CelD/BcsL family acetyltransferase involved in cellulose biosynthesis n=1 Tax=Kitasatospora atroaurantiaca TaxID=285545 RepID=A0A561EL10_9ACTN|nr:GNAT family N-acetyltransferase [Kitasatospora atroaurantiaca]TWE16249.1 CelD/BcsL family acetyltransferase involved in cellulose biosynthesis [Kitasatospora atroaurantiaca]